MMHGLREVMTDMMKVAAADFQRNIERYQDLPCASPWR